MRCGGGASSAICNRNPVGCQDSGLCPQDVTTTELFLLARSRESVEQACVTLVN